LAAERGLTIAATYVENESGAKLARPELLRVLVEGALRGRRTPLARRATSLWHGPARLGAREPATGRRLLRKVPFDHHGISDRLRLSGCLLTVALAWLWLRDLELALLLAPTGGMLVVFVALVVAIFVAPRSAPPRSGLSSRA